jgi:4-amino-4-deoxy-L-arabinose transferase-like glycosyltransferase
MTASTRMRFNLLGVTVVGLFLRLFFIWKFPFNQSGDSPFYEQLAGNWLYHGVYGLWLNGQLVPENIRMPGYPALLAAVYAIFGRSVTAVLWVQASIDLVTCFLTAVIAARVAPEASRRRVTIAALWLAALCPFLANYSAATLTEVLTTFLTTLALVVLLRPMALVEVPAHDNRMLVRNTSILGGFLAGLGALVRPETPLLLGAIGLVLVIRCRRPQNWLKLMRAGLWMGLGLFLALLPWAARNWQTMHKVQFLAPRYSELPGEFVPHGFRAWTGTWLWRFHDVYLVPWKIDEEHIRVDQDVPASAFDSLDERARIAELFDRYNQTTTMSPSVDRGFAEVARERTVRHPLRTYVYVPLLRAWTMWTTPRVEILPFTGSIWPIGNSWEDDPMDFSVSASFWLINLAYLGMAIAGAWLARGRPAAAFLVAFILVRTAFFTYVDTPEPRYVLECFPAVCALASQVWARSTIRNP